MKSKIMILMLATALACSCDNDAEPILYRASMMGFLQEDGSFNGDDGRTYVFSNVDQSHSWQNAERIITVIDVTKELSENRYSAKLIAYDFPLYKKAFVGETPQVVDSLGTDPILYEDGWYSGGCLNMINTFTHGSMDVQHSVSLLVKEFPTASDTLKVRIMHNAAEDQGDVAFTFYSSFPISEYLPDDGQTVLEIEWLWDEELHKVYKTIKK